MNRRFLPALLAGFVLLHSTALLAAKAKPAAPAKGGPASGDTTPPTIDHTPLKTVEAGAVIVVRAKFADPSGVFSPKVFVRPAGKAEFTPYNFSQRAQDEYDVQLPPEVSAGGTFAYYLEAFDGNGNGPARSGSPTSPHQAVAVDPPPKPVRVSVRSEPAGASVSVDERPSGASPLSLQLMPGRHVLLLSAPGRRSLEQRLELVSGRDVEVVAALRTEGGTGRLRVESAPQGARLFVDGTPAGVTPFETTGLSGPHHLRAELDGFLPEERQVSLETTRDAEVAFAMRKLPETPAVAIESTPSGATVTIDGAERGVTPWLGIVPAGDHEVVLTSGGRSVASAFTTTGKNDVLLRLTLPEAREDHASLLAVTTDPAGADVTLDGQKVGRSPWLGVLPKKDVDVAVKLEGYEPVQKHLPYEENRDRELSLVLAREPGPAMVALVANPRDAALTVDGKPVGKGQAALQVEPGDHEVAGSREGRATVAQLVHVEPGQQLVVTLDLPAAGPKKTTPLLSVESSPAGAIVLVDGQEVGNTPLSRRELKAGKHTVELRAKDSAPYKTTVNVPDVANYEVRLAAVLAPMRGLVERPVATKRQIVDAQLERGTECFAAKDWACAADAFTRAYALEAEPDYLYEAALAEANLKQWKDAGAHAKTVLGATKSAKLKKQAKALVARCEAGEKAPADKAAAPTDTIAPELSHKAVALVYRQRPVNLTATIRDDGGIFLPQACWRSLLAPEWACGNLEHGDGDTYAITIPGAAVSQGFAYYLQAFDLDGNGPARAGSAQEPLVPAIEEAPADLGFLAGATSGELETPGFFASRSTASLAVLGVGAAAAVGAIATFGMSYGKVAGDKLDANNVHTTTQAQAASARTLSNVGIGLSAAAAVGLGVGLFVLGPDDGAGAGAGISGTF